jgi:hypothetical protein
LIEIKAIARRGRYCSAIMLRSITRSLFALLLAALAGGSFMRPAEAEPNLEYPILLAIKEHYLGRLKANGCTPYFSYHATDIANWRWNPDEVKAEVVFSVKYIGVETAVGNAERARDCLARNASGAFKPDEVYNTAPLVYTLSKWSQGWHVDKLELQP